MTPEERAQKRLKKAVHMFIGFCISIAMFYLLYDVTARSVVYYVIGELTGMAIISVATMLETHEED
jgi:serine phosphatase RsbU (regulator of sigma subunit)